MVVFMTVCCVLVFVIIAVLGMACASADVVDAAAEAASDMKPSTSGPVSARSLAATAGTGERRGTVSECSSVQHTPAEYKQTGVNIIDESRSYLSILEQLCDELGLSRPTDKVTQESEAYVATLSVKYAYSSSQSHAKKADAQEDAARVALTALRVGVDESARNCRAQLNEYCQQQQFKPGYKPSDEGPFACTVYVPIVHQSLSLPTRREAIDNAALGILNTLGDFSHVSQMFDKFEKFSVSYNAADSVFTLIARYHFTRPVMGLMGDKSKKTAEKLAAEHVLSVLYPDFPKPELDKCKNVLQEMHSQRLPMPKYTDVCENGLYYGEVSVTFLEQMTGSDSRSTLSAVNNLAKRTCKRLGLISLNV